MFLLYRLNLGAPIWPIEVGGDLSSDLLWSGKKVDTIHPDTYEQAPRQHWDMRHVYV
jgi:hypothetical protein